MLVHSCIYYEMDTNIVDDATWSRWAVELAKLQEDYPEIAKKVEYAYAFKNWDGSTGAFLPYKDPNIVSKALMLLEIHSKK